MCITKKIWPPVNNKCTTKINIRCEIENLPPGWSADLAYRKDKIGNVTPLYVSLHRVGNLEEINKAKIANSIKVKAEIV